MDASAVDGSIDDSASTVDVARTDASAPRDTGTDAITVDTSVIDVVAPVDGAVGCARYPSATFCDDFDYETNLYPHWDGGDYPGSATAFVMIGAQPYVSPPNALLAHIGQNDPNRTTAALFYPLPRHIFVGELDVLVQNNCGDVQLVFLQEKDSLGTEVDVKIWALQSGYAQLECNGSTVQPGAFAASGWTHLQVVLDFSIGYAQLTVGETSAGLGIPKVSQPSSALIEVGLVYANAPLSSDCNYHFDDVAFFY